MSDDKSIWTSDNVYLIGFLSSVLLSVTPSIQMFGLISKKIQVHTISLFPLLCLYSNCGLFFFPATYSNTQQHKRTLESSFIELLQLNWLMF